MSKKTQEVLWEQEVSKEVFTKKYMINGEKDALDVFRGVAKEIASVEKLLKRKYWEEVFFEELASSRFIPGGRILANARPKAKMPFYNNCYTISVEDSIEGIYNSLQEDAKISRTGGGVGINFSKLRPKDSGLSTGGQSSGVLSFMKVFNESAKIIQTGGSRRAAHIGILNVDHPEIEAFILAKKGDKNKELTQFNISVGITNAFMRAVENDEDWNLVFNKKVYKTVKAKYLYDLMAQNAYLHNEPGILNLDTINDMNNGWYGFSIFEVNPCGEIVMPAYSLCCLGSVNLTKFVKNAFTKDSYFDLSEFRRTVSIGVRFLDNVLDATQYPLEKIEVVSKKWRRIGLGFTGLGDAFAMMGFSYGDEESKLLSENIGSTLRGTSYDTSVDLAIEKGSFPECNNRKLSQSGFIMKLPDRLRTRIRRHGLRNIAMNTVAPTGTTALSIGQNCSSGIEPIFSLQYNRSIRTGFGDEVKSETVYDHAWLKYIEYAKETGVETMGGTYPVPEYFKTTFDIDVYDAMEIQIIFQQYIDHSISKTLNLPHGTTYDQYKDLFKYAYNNGLKGFTTFNPDGSMKGILESSDKKEDDIDRVAVKRPKELPCNITEMKYKGGNYLLLVGMYEGLPYEIFVTPNDDKEFKVRKIKTGKIVKVKKGKYSLFLDGDEESVIDDITSQFDPQYGSLGRILSMSLRHKVPLQFIIDQLDKDEEFLGFERTVSRTLKKYVSDGEVVKSSKTCEDCGGTEFAYQEGCLKCLDCGWSKCS
jgi:ribonucleoside-diphosphate reductase alpha chain